MKISSTLILATALFTLGTFAQQDTALYEFAPKTAPVEKAVTAVTTETANTAAATTEATAPVAEVPAQDVLVADAQSLIKDKLVQKYQLALDDVIARLTDKLTMVSAEAQRTALTELHDRLEEKKEAVKTQKNLDPLKQEIIIALLDHLLLRIDGLIKQSAQTTTKYSQA